MKIETKKRKNRKEEVFSSFFLSSLLAVGRIFLPCNCIRQRINGQPLEAEIEICRTLLESSLESLAGVLSGEYAGVLSCLSPLWRVLLESSLTRVLSGEYAGVLSCLSPLWRVLLESSLTRVLSGESCRSPLLLESSLESLAGVLSYSSPLWRVLQESSLESLAGVLSEESC